MCIRDRVTTLIANTKGEGKAGDDFWVKAETLLYCALIGYIPVSYTHLDVYKRQPLRACALCRGLISAQGDFPALRYGGFAATRGCTPCAAYAAIPAHPQKQYTRPGICTIFAGFIILSGR